MRWADNRDEIINICGIKGCGKKAKFQGRKENGVFVLEGKDVVIDGSSDKIEYVLIMCNLKKCCRLSTIHCTIPKT